jgi:ferric-dicitrate binding protein FerR (iron transport regulator)
MIEKDQLYGLFDRYMQKTATPAEKEMFLQLLADPAYEAIFTEINESYHTLPSRQVTVNPETTEAIWQAIRTGVPVAAAPVRRMQVVRRWWAAAVLLLVAGAGVLLWIQRAPHPAITAAAVTPVIQPGKVGAVLTLANGETVVLDSLGNGVVARENGADVRLANGQLTYDTVDIVMLPVEKMTYNMMTTPRGCQFQLVLPDGTKVWLNAASSIRYPTAFMGNQRRVEITGEAYFEVAADAQRAFFVKANNQAEIQVLGTHFNINAYNDEPALKTTLLEGSVNVLPVSAGNITPVLLHPDEECVLQQGRIVVNRVDVEAAVAWINGLFYFKSADLQMVLRQVARWYDVEIRYEGKINARFSGSVYRSEHIEELLKVIEYTSNVKCTINQKTITVSPK